MSDFSSKPTLAGDRVVLRPFRDGDADAMWESFADPSPPGSGSTATLMSMLETDWASRGDAPAGAILRGADEPARES